MMDNLRDKMEMLPATYRFLLEPVALDAPCGEDLEYDPHYMELFIRIVPKEKKVIGGSMGSERLESEFEPIRWSEVERDCLDILRRTRDLRLLAVWLRCRAQQAQATGLRQGLFVMERLLKLWPEELYPRMESEGEPDPLSRADALLALAESQGLLADIRSMPVCGSGGLRMEVRDIERSFSLPLPEDAIPPEAMRHRLNELRLNPSPEYTALLDALALARSIDAQAHAQLGLDAPDLSRLLDLLQWLEGYGKQEPSLQPPADGHATPELGQGEVVAPPGVMDTSGGFGEAGTGDVSAGAVAPPPSGGIANRHVARERIREIRLWLEEHEPSSPVPLLLRQAERLIGKRFAEVVNCLPQELLEKWEND